MVHSKAHLQTLSPLLLQIHSCAHSQGMCWSIAHQCACLGVGATQRVLRNKACHLWVLRAKTQQVHRGLQPSRWFGFATWHQHKMPQTWGINQCLKTDLPIAQIALLRRLRCYSMYQHLFGQPVGWMLWLHSQRQLQRWLRLPLCTGQ